MVNILLLPPARRAPWRPLLTAVVAQLGDRAAGGELVPRVAGRHLRRLPIAGLLQLDQAGAGGGLTALSPPAASDR